MVFIREEVAVWFQLAELRSGGTAYRRFHAVPLQALSRITGVKSHEIMLETFNEKFVIPRKFHEILHH